MKGHMMQALGYTILALFVWRHFCAVFGQFYDAEPTGVG
jgi:hypothetical protein